MSETKIITLLNHQGGVGKTVTAWNLGCALSKYERVLLVDGDPACGLTRLFLRNDRAFQNYYSDDDGKKNNIRGGVKAAFRESRRRVQAVECFSPEWNDNLFLLPGHKNLAAYEPDIRQTLEGYSMDWDAPGSFYALISLCAEKYAIHYVLLDTGPGLGALNQIFFSICDAFIIPSRADPFARGAMKTLKKILPFWKQEARLLQSRSADSNYPMPPADMRYLGAMIRAEALYAEVADYARNKMRRKFWDDDMTAPKTFTAPIDESPALLDIALESRAPVPDLRSDELPPELRPVLEHSRKIYHAVGEHITEYV